MKQKPELQNQNRYRCRFVKGDLDSDVNLCGQILNSKVYVALEQHTTIFQITLQYKFALDTMSSNNQAGLGVHPIRLPPN